MKKFAGALAALAFAAAGSATAAPTTIYSNNFDSGGETAAFGTAVAFLAAGGGTTPVGGTSTGAYGLVFRNTTSGETTWTLSNLAAHDKLYLDFTGILVDSWDGTGSSSVAPDYLYVDAAGVPLAAFSADNYNNCCLSLDGATPYAFGEFIGNAGFNDQSFVSKIYEIAHTGSSFTFSFRAGGSGFQYGTDESWAIDNLRIQADLRDDGPGPIPEPATWAMMILGFGAAGTAIRNRRRALATA